MRSRAAIAAVGAAAGTVAALGATALAAGFLVDGAAQAVVVNQRLESSRALIEAQDVHLFLYVVAAGVVAGALISALTSMFAAQADPAQARLGVGPLTVIGGLVGAVMSYSALRVGIGVGGQIDQGLVTISAFRAIVIFASAGAVVGAVSSLLAERLSRPEVVGVGSESWPTNRAAFIKESMPALLIPLLTLVVVAAMVFGMSEALLAGNNVLAVSLATAISLTVLGVGAFLAYSPRGHDSDTDESGVVDL